MSDSKDFSEPMSAPSSAPELAPVQKADVMSAVRNAKKRKAQEDRDALSDLRKQVGSLAEAMSNKPEVVTRPQKDEETSMPSKIVFLNKLFEAIFAFRRRRASIELA